MIAVPLRIRRWGYLLLALSPIWVLWIFVNVWEPTQKTVTITLATAFGLGCWGAWRYWHINRDAFHAWLILYMYVLPLVVMVLSYVAQWL